jgi:hypothetical protein
MAIVQPMSASIIICQSVINENGIFSAIRVLNSLTLGPTVTQFTFAVLTVVNGYPGDPYEHIFSLRMVTLEDRVIASVPDQRVTLANKQDPYGPRTFLAATNFLLNLQALGSLGAFKVCAYVDEVLVASAPITLRRAQSA